MDDDLLTQAHILIVHIFILNIILTIPCCTRTNDFYARFL